MTSSQRDLELINGFCSGNLTDKEFAEFENELRQRSDLRQLLVEYRALESALPSAVALSSVPPVKSAPPPASRTGAIRSWRTGALTLVLIVLLVGGIAYFWPRSPADIKTGEPHVAVVTQAVGAYDSEGVPIRSGHRMTPGHLNLDRGLIRLDFVNGASIAVEGPASIDVLNDMHMVLSRGIVTARIPDSATGFVMETETAHVIDLGTAFGISVDEDGATDVCVFEGKVSVNRRGSQTTEPAMVFEGQAVRALEQSPAIVSTDYQVTAFENTWPVNSGVLQTTGSIRFVSPGPGFQPGNHQDNEHIVVFPERSDFVLKEAIHVDMVDPGQYARSRHREKRALPAGSRVTSYLLQFDALPAQQSSNRKRSVRGQVTFAKPIVGVITTTRLLKESEATFGNPEVDYPTPRAVEPRPEGDQRPGFDSVILAADQRTLILDLKVAPQKLDQLRVLVEAD